MFNLIKVISFKFSKLNILNASRNVLFILLILLSELRANILKKKLDAKNNDVIIITDFKGDSLSKLISQLKSNSTLKPLSERIERTIRLSNQKNNQHSNSTSYLNGLNSFIRTNDKSAISLASKLSNKLNLFADNSNDKSYYKPFTSFNYLNNYNQLYQRLNGYDYSQARYPQNGYFVHNNRPNQAKDFNYPYQLANYDPNRFNYNYNHKMNYDYKPLIYDYKPVTFDQNKYLPTNYDQSAFAYSTQPPITVTARPITNSISDIISNQQQMPDHIADQMPDTYANSSFIDQVEDPTKRNAYDRHPLSRSKFRHYYRQLPPSIPFYINSNKNIRKIKTNHHSNKQPDTNQTDRITNELINSLINKLNEKKFLNNQNPRVDKTAINLPVNLNQLTNKSSEEQDELIKNSNLLTKFEQINNKILTNLLLTTYLSNLSKNQPKINASLNRSIYLDTLEDDSQDRLAESNIIRKKVRRRSQPSQIIIKKYIQVPTARRRVRKIQRKTLSNNNNNNNGNKSVLRPLIIKKIETPSIVIETPSKLKKSYNFNNFKRLNYLNDGEDDDENLFNYDSLNSDSYGLSNLNSLNAYELNSSKFGDSKFDLNNYAIGKLNDKLYDHPLSNYKTFNHFSKPNFEQMDTLNNRLPNYASSNYMSNRNLYLKRNKIDMNEQQPDDNQFNESNPKKVSSLLHTVSALPEYYPALSTRRPYLSSTIAYNENGNLFLNRPKKILIEDKLIDEKDTENYPKNEQENYQKNGHFFKQKIDQDESYEKVDENKKDERFLRHNEKSNADLAENHNSTSKLVYTPDNLDASTHPTKPPKLIIIDQTINK